MCPGGKHISSKILGCYCRKSATSVGVVTVKQRQQPNRKRQHVGYQCISTKVEWIYFYILSQWGLDIKVRH